MAWRTCYTATVNGRQIVVRHRTPDPDEMALHLSMSLDWYTGYVEVLPTDGIDAEDYERYDNEIEAPGGLTFGGSLSEYPDKQFLGFDTAHFGMEKYIMADAINGTAKMQRDIEKYREQHGKESEN